MSDSPTLTRAQADAAQRRIHENLALRSGAGSGKTAVLSRRFTELLLSSDQAQPLRRFVALTFTDKAAMEMSQRVRSLLVERARLAKGESRQKILSWLEEVDDARISTIHGFCSTLLRASAVQAGIDPAFGVLSDDLAISQMVDEAVEAVLLAAIEQESVADAPPVSVAGVSPARNAGILPACGTGIPPAASLVWAMGLSAVLEQVHLLVRTRTMWRLEDYGDGASILARWRSMHQQLRANAWAELSADASIRASLDELESFNCADSSDSLCAFLDEKLSLARMILNDPARRTADAFACIAQPPGRLGSDKNWGGKGSTKAVRDAYRQLAEQLGAYAIFAQELGDLDARAAEALAALAHLAGQAIDAYAAAKRKAGVLDFDDLLALSHKLLRENADIRLRVQSQLDQLLIDECQDTDALQAQLLAMVVFPDDVWRPLLDRMAAGPDALKGPDTPPLSLPDGRLFMVGDDKQSIYRFRGAQVEVFNSLCRSLGQARQETLDKSFRTHDAGISFVNHVFARLMGQAYCPTTASRSFAPARPTPPVEILLADAPEGEAISSADEATAAQAALTAQRIANMIAASERLVYDKAAGDWRPVRAGDIAILFSRMTNSLDYERELARRDIPYYVVAGTGFFRQQEVFDILNALRVIDNPYDDVAFFGLLRSSIFGLDDNALMHISMTARPPYLPGIEPALADADAPWRRSLQFAVGLLRQLHMIKDAVAIDELIEELVARTGYEATLLSQFQGKRMAGNLRMLIEQARSASRACLTLADFIRLQGERILSQSRYEQSAVAGEAENVVRIMTIHKAKGLEFPVVFIPDLNAGRRIVSDSLINRTDFGLAYKFSAEQPAGGDAANGDDEAEELPLSYRLCRHVENLDDRKEDIRKLYVALTRHEDHLVLVGANWRTKDGRIRAKDGHLAMLDDALGFLGRIGADEAGRQVDVPFADGKYAARVQLIPPVPPAGSGREPSIGQRLLGSSASPEEFGAAIQGQIDGGGPASPLVGPLPDSIGVVELAVTSLGDYKRCPMLYRWRHELRVPVDLPGLAQRPRNQLEAASAPALAPLPLNAATLGTLLHRCMECLDMARPQSPDVLVGSCMDELGLADLAPLAAVQDHCRPMLEAFLAHPLRQELLSARQVHRELDFILRDDPLVLRGKIDLTYQDAAGNWHIVDYKSDQLRPDESPADHARHYRMQLLLYAAAAGRFHGQRPTDARLFFLRSGVEHAFALDQGQAESALAEARQLARSLIYDRRRGLFARREESACAFCQYARLCEGIAG